MSGRVVVILYSIILQNTVAADFLLFLNMYPEQSTKMKVAVANSGVWRNRSGSSNLTSALSVFFGNCLYIANCLRMFLLYRRTSATHLHLTSDLTSLAL